MRKARLPKNYSWIKENFPKLVNRYGGQYVVVAGGEIFAGKSPQVLEKEAKEKYPKEIPFGMPVPRPEDFTCAL